MVIVSEALLGNGPTGAPSSRPVHSSPLWSTDRVADPLGGAHCHTSARVAPRSARLYGDTVRLQPIPKDVNADQVRHVCERHGVVRWVSEMAACSCFVTFGNTKQAEAAMQAMDGTKVWFRVREAGCTTRVRP